MTDLALIVKATNFAAHKHRNQRRKNKEAAPYINHPIEVAHLLIEVGDVISPKALCAALLHDTIEDTETTYEEIKEHFGPDIANIVKEVTDDKSLDKVQRKKLQIENAVKKCHHAKLVKLADKLSNLRSLLTDPPKDWSPSIIEGYFIWAYKVVAGLRNTNSGLETELDKVFAQVIKPDMDLDFLLQVYYVELSK